MFSNKTLLITGGTGSFGNEVLSRFLSTNISEIRVFSRDEKKQDDMRRKYNNAKIKYYIGDVRDLNSISNAIQGVDYVFHAAALKQVPSCEFFPIEAVKTNILGTENMLNAAIDARVRKVVCLSTDKAAYPVNAMGISKAMMERVFIAKARNISSDSTIISGTRYGNVMCSRGSVIPLFIDQIKQGKPITVTDPQMTRFIMSLEESIDLVLFAFANAQAGDIMVQKAPSCYIGDLAQAIKEIFEVDNQIKCIGMRHGEKRYEVLLTKEESAKAIDEGKYFRVPSDNRDLNYEKYLEYGSPLISITDEFNSVNTEILNIECIKKKLLQLNYIQESLSEWREINR